MRVFSFAGIAEATAHKTEALAEAKQVFFALERVRFAPVAGPISQAVSDTVGIQMAATSRSLFK